MVVRWLLNHQILPPLTRKSNEEVRLSQESQQSHSVSSCHRLSQVLMPEPVLWLGGMLEADYLRPRLQRTPELEWSLL